MVCCSQQSHLLVNGMAVSSCVWYRHFKTPTSVLIGNGFVGFLRPIWLADLNNSLSTLGCVCSWMLLLTLLSRCILILPYFSSATLSVSKPNNSNNCKPPSRPMRKFILSSMRKWTLQRKQSTSVRMSTLINNIIGVLLFSWNASLGPSDRSSCTANCSWSQIRNLLSFALQLIHEAIDVLRFASQFECIASRSWFPI